MQVLTHDDIAVLDRDAFYSPRPETVEQFALSIEASELLAEYEHALKTMRRAQNYLFMALSGAGPESFHDHVAHAWAVLAGVAK